MELSTPGASERHGDVEGEPGAAALSRYGRRALMLGAGAAGAGLAATLAGSGDPAAAANSNPVELGDSNSASASTVITTTGGNGLNGITTSDKSYACGLLGESQYGIGVYGTQSSTSGLLGATFGSYDVPTTAAVVGDTGSKTPGVTPLGVLGLGNAGGVAGFSTEGYGVTGLSENFIGVYGISTGDGGYGVYGESDIGTGVYASGPVALEVVGVANFSRSGVATVAGTSTKPAQTVTVTGVALTSSSLILATPQGIAPGVAVEGVVPDVSGSSFVIHLTKAITISLTVAWFVVG